MINMYQTKRTIPTTMDGLPVWKVGVAKTPIAQALLPDTDGAAAKRNALAAVAQARYDTWSSLNAEDDEPHASLEKHPSEHTFRDRNVAKELHETSRMNFRRFNTEKERIDQAVANFHIIKRPVYESPGAYTLGTYYAFTRRGYLMRQRMKSMEVGGPMRFGAAIGGERIRESIKAASMLDVLSGEGDPEEQRQKQLAHAMYRPQHKDKWVDKHDFHRGRRPLREPFGKFATLSGPYVETLDADTYGNLNYGHTRVRVPEREMSSTPFASSTPSGVYLPNLSRVCTWNVVHEPSPMPRKTYYRSGISVPSSTATL